MKIAVIVLHYRNLSDTLECLETLAAQDYPDFEIILVNNGSSDCLPNTFHAIHLSHNVGFAAGCNIGMKTAFERGAKAVLLLNNDTVAAPDLLSNFVRASLAHPEGGVFGAKIYYYQEPTTIWHAGGGVNLKKLRCYHHGCPDDDLNGEWNEMRDVEYVCGCALFVTKQAIEKVGYMAPEFFLLWEEIDWCWRIRQAGFRCLYIPEARVWHKISQSFEGGNRGPLWQYYYYRNRLLFLKSHFPRKICWQFYLTILRSEIWHLILQLLKPSSKNKLLYRSALKGILSSLFVKPYYK